MGPVASRAERPVRVFLATQDDAARRTLAGMLRRDWAWYAGFVIQAILIVAGFIFHISLTILGVLFLLMWIYVVSVRRTVLGTGHKAAGKS